MKVPFGAKIQFIPNDTTAEGMAQAKFAPSTIYGIFAGYEMSDGKGS